MPVGAVVKVADFRCDHAYVRFDVKRSALDFVDNYVARPVNFNDEHVLSVRVARDGGTNSKRRHPICLITALSKVTKITAEMQRAPGYDGFQMMDLLT